VRNQLTVLVHAGFHALGKSTSSALVAMRFVDRTTSSSAARLTGVLATLPYRTLHHARHYMSIVIKHKPIFKSLQLAHSLYYLQIWW